MQMCVDGEWVEIGITFAFLAGHGLDWLWVLFQGPVASRSCVFYACPEISNNIFNAHRQTPTTQTPFDCVRLSWGVAIYIGNLMVFPIGFDYN